MPKYMPMIEFIRTGLLQEANRQFFHPLGLELEIFITGDGITARVQDYRDDPEGICFISVDAERAAWVESLAAKQGAARYQKFGYTVQPVAQTQEEIELRAEARRRQIDAEARRRQIASSRR
jgi:hypothetical protein